MPSEFTNVGIVDVDPDSARIFEHGWQSGSPSTTYALADRPFRPTSDARRATCYRPDQVAPDDAFQGEGLLAVQAAASGPVHVFAARGGLLAVPSIRAEVENGRVVVRADAEVDALVVDTPDVQAALATWADGFAARAGVSGIRPAHNLAAMDEPRTAGGGAPGRRPGRDVTANGAGLPPYAAAVWPRGATGRSRTG